MLEGLARNNQKATRVTLIFSVATQQDSTKNTCSRRSHGSKRVATRAVRVQRHGRLATKTRHGSRASTACPLPPLAWPSRARAVRMQRQGRLATRTWHGRHHDYSYNVPHPPSGNAVEPGLVVSGVEWRRDGRAALQRAGSRRLRPFPTLDPLSTLHSLLPTSHSLPSNHSHLSWCVLSFIHPSTCLSVPQPTLILPLPLSVAAAARCRRRFAAVSPPMSEERARNDDCRCVFQR